MSPQPRESASYDNASPLGANRFELEAGHTTHRCAFAQMTAM
jgi:hypothetical protein